MSSSAVDVHLDLLESEFKALSACLIDSRLDALLAAGATLQRLSVELAEMAKGAGQMRLKSSPQLLRIKALAAGIANVRENLLRQLAFVGRALEIVVPATRDKSTYAGGGVYGQPVQQSGAFSVLSA
nr:hypothetical protein [uncultured Rhodoferax sp.]